MTATLALLAADKQSGNPLLSLLVFALPLGAIFYLMVIPQRKQRAKQQEFLSALEVGDEVVTSGGIYGTINHLEDGVAHLQVDTQTVIRVAVSSLSRSAQADPEPSTAAGSDHDAPADKRKAK